MPYRLGVGTQITELCGLRLWEEGGRGCRTVRRVLKPTEGSYSLRPVLWVSVLLNIQPLDESHIHAHLYSTAPGPFLPWCLHFSSLSSPRSESIQSFASSIVRADRPGLMTTPLSNSNYKIFPRLQHKSLLKIDPFPPQLPISQVLFLH